MAKSFISMVLLLVFFSSVYSKDYTIADFKKNYFKIITANKGFYEVKAGFENATNEIVIGTGFVNNDLYADIITVTRDKKVAKFYIYDDEANKFKLNMVSPTLPANHSIVNVKLTQIKSNDGYPDAIIITQWKNGGAITTRFTGYSINKGGAGEYDYGLTAIEGYSFDNVYPTTDKTQEPFNIQIFEEGGLVDYWLLTNVDGRVLYYYDKASSTFKSKNFTDILDQTCSGCIPLSNIEGNMIPEAYTSAYIDINRDCRSDIVLETVKNNKRYLEFYYYINRNQFGLIKVVPVPGDYSLGTVEDINENNNPDLLFIEKQTGNLKVFLNNYSAADSTSAMYCSDVVSTAFMFPGLEDPADKKYTLTQSLIVNSSLYEDANAGIRGFIRLGDLDLDSYKDLTLNLTVGGKNEVFVFLNKPCKSTYAADIGMSEDLCRYFDPTSISDEDTSAMKNKSAIQSIYFDLGERGKLGFISVESDSAGYRISTYINNYEIENYFLKAIGFANQSELQSLNGARFMIKKTEVNGDIKIFSKTQNTNCPFYQACLPYVHIGLAKINNYVEDFLIGINKSDDWKKSWSPIIPNSQLIVYTNPSSSYNMKLNIFINPTSAMLFIFLSTIIVLLVLGFIILYLHCKEKSIDRKFQINDFNIL